MSKQVENVQIMAPTRPEQMTLKVQNCEKNVGLRVATTDLVRTKCRKTDKNLFLMKQNRKWLATARCAYARIADEPSISAALLCHLPQNVCNTFALESFVGSVHNLHVRGNVSFKSLHARGFKISGSRGIG